MSEEQPTGQQQDEQRRIQVRDAAECTQYANFFTITGGQDVLVISYGNQVGSPDTIQIESKVALSPRNAKRMAISLAQVIRRYEGQYGEIDIVAPAQGQQAAAPEQATGAGQ